ncbi:P-loop containing nucleoside triphosphate hydrolase protein, partial [Pseudomassariella vexata]
LERPEVLPIPSAIIPFNHDEDFVERREIFDRVHQKCARPGSRTALVGLGEVGKSQIAIEHAYQTRMRSPETWVFWVHASNRTRFEQSFRDIANYVKISGRQNPKANTFQLVHDWLRDERKGKWVLILDNLDDTGFLLESASPDRETDGLDSGNSKLLVSYLPQCPNGSILITTRDKNAALQLVEQSSIITVEPMDSAHALALVQKKLDTQENNDELSEFATSLEFMPLAIVQATAYISRRSPRCSVRQYLEEFRKSDRKKTSLLNYEGGELRRDREAKNYIIITWQLSFDHIRRIKPSAADLLSLMSFFDRQGIPEALLRNYSGPGNNQQHQNESDDDSDGVGKIVYYTVICKSGDYEDSVSKDPRYIGLVLWQLYHADSPITSLDMLIMLIPALVAMLLLFCHRVQRDSHVHRTCSHPFR